MDKCDYSKMVAFVFCFLFFAFMLSYLIFTLRSEDFAVKSLEELYKMNHNFEILSGIYSLVPVYGGYLICWLFHELSPGEKTKLC